MNIYMLSFSAIGNNLTRKDILDFFDTRREVLNWFAVMPSTILVVSNDNHTILSELLRRAFGNRITFLLTKIESQSIDGFIAPEVWDFINSPKSSGRWK